MTTCKGWIIPGRRFYFSLKQTLLLPWLSSSMILISLLCSFTDKLCLLYDFCCSISCFLVNWLSLIMFVLAQTFLHQSWASSHQHLLIAQPYQPILYKKYFFKKRITVLFSYLDFVFKYSQLFVLEDQRALLYTWLCIFCYIVSTVKEYSNQICCEILRNVIEVIYFIEHTCFIIVNINWVTITIIIMTSWHQLISRPPCTTFIFRIEFSEQSSISQGVKTV